MSGVRVHLTGAWFAQHARNVLMDLDQCACGLRFLLPDRNTFSAAFDAVFTGADSPARYTSKPQTFHRSAKAFILGAPARTRATRMPGATPSRVG